MITFHNVTKAFNGATVLSGIDFHIGKNELAVITGPSGSGKTTLLRLIAGTLQPDNGEVTVSGNRTGFIFQDHRLLPWKTAVENIALVLRATGMKHDEAKQRAMVWLERVGLADYRYYYPAQLSGGMVQRVSIARAFSIEPDIILMDEPFSSLDDEITDSLLLMVQKVLAEHHATVVYVTHDIMEALRLADRLFELREDGFKEIPIEDRQAMLRDYYAARLKAVTPVDTNG